MPADALIRLGKGVFGLREAPRLWYEKLRRTVRNGGWRSMRSAPGIFYLQDEHGKLCGLPPHGAGTLGYPIRCGS